MPCNDFPGHSIFVLNVRTHVYACVRMYKRVSMHSQKKEDKLGLKIKECMRGGYYHFFFEAHAEEGSQEYDCFILWNLLDASSGKITKLGVYVEGI